jgi:hypothetical protein
MPARSSYRASNTAAAAAAGGGAACAAAAHDYSTGERTEPFLDLSSRGYSTLPALLLLQLLRDSVLDSFNYRNGERNDWAVVVVLSVE